MMPRHLTNLFFLLCSLMGCAGTGLADTRPPPHAPTLTEQIEKKVGALVRLKLTNALHQNSESEKVVSVTCDASAQTFRATVETADGQRHERCGTFVFQTSAPVLNASVQRNNPLSSKHIVWQRCDVSPRTQGALRPDAIDKRKASLDLAPGTILSTQNTLEASTSHQLPRNAPVTLLYKTKNITIRAGGARLKKAAHVGDIALVTNPFGTHKDTLHGRLNAASQVVIGSS